LLFAARGSWPFGEIVSVDADKDVDLDIAVAPTDGEDFTTFASMLEEGRRVPRRWSEGERADSRWLVVDESHPMDARFRSVVGFNGSSLSFWSSAFTDERIQRRKASATVCRRRLHRELGVARSKGDHSWLERHQQISQVR
jgi:hypothetical protein